MTTAAPFEYDDFQFMEFFLGCTRECLAGTTDGEDVGFSDCSSYCGASLAMNTPAFSDQADMDTESRQMGLHSSSSNAKSDAESLSGSMNVEAGSEGCEAPATSNNSPLLPLSTHSAPPPRYVPPPPMRALTQKAQCASPMLPLSATITVEELVTLGLVRNPVILRPQYPSHLPLVRCCYDSNKRKGCDKGSNCYHIHANPTDRRKPATQKCPHEIYVERPHFALYEGMVPQPHIQSLPCQYGMGCKNPLHRDCAVRFSLNDAALADYNAYFRAFRDYEFQMIQQQLAVIRARRELTDDMIWRARSAHAAAECRGAPW